MTVRVDGPGSADRPGVSTDGLEGVLKALSLAQAAYGFGSKFSDFMGQYGGPGIADPGPSSNAPWSTASSSPLQTPKIQQISISPNTTAVDRKLKEVYAFQSKRA